MSEPKASESAVQSEPKASESAVQSEPKASESFGMSEPEASESAVQSEPEASEASSTRRVFVLNGPNLGRLGSREPDVYGVATLADLAGVCVATGRALGLDVEVRQTDSETELIGWVHEAADGRIPVVLNPAAFTHYSYALRDALATRTAPLVEVHISNPAAREKFRHTSVVAGVANGTIAGFGLTSYTLALEAIAELTAPSAPPAWAPSAPSAGPGAPGPYQLG
jgi:3-dehydroquinate dehydratase II